MRTWRIPQRIGALLTGAMVLLSSWSCGPLGAQERSLSATSHGATAQERLLIEQVDQLVQAGQYAEATLNLRRLTENSQGRLIEIGAAQQAATLQTQLHIPITQWANESLVRWSKIDQESIARVLAGEDETAVAALQEAGIDCGAIAKGLERFPLAPASGPARLTLCDLYLDRGWTTAARQTLDGPGIAWRLRAVDDTSMSGLPWPAAWPHVKEADTLDALLDHSWSRITGQLEGSSDRLKLELLKRIVTVSALDATKLEFQATVDWLEHMQRRLPEPLRDDLAKALASAKQLHHDRFQWQGEQVARAPTFAGSAQRNGECEARLGQPQPGSWPSWSKQVERLTGVADRNPASKPPVAESLTGLLPYHPLVHEGRVYVHELTRIMAYDEISGASWPTSPTAMPLFDSGLIAANYLPFGYQVMGAPRGTLTIDRDVLYARMGAPITAWHGRAPTSEPRSLSYLVALDLTRQGSMRPGFPVYLAADSFPNAELEGAPVISGHQAIVCISQRDNVNLRRSVISIDTRTGQIQWRSPVLAAGMVSGSEQLSLIAHQLPTVAGGRIFLNTNLGSIACVDQSDGHIVWLMRYRRSAPVGEEPYPKPDRYRYRDLTPCMVVGTQVICAPQDCPEIFALDIASGELLWSTDGEQVDDATQLLGVCGENLLISGDRLYWLDRQSGRVLAAFPSGNLGEVANALPAPRGYGRGTLNGSRVYWPTSNEIYVFDADQTPEVLAAGPQIAQRIRLDTRGAEGGNLLLLKDGLLIAGVSRIFVYKSSGIDPP